MTDAVAEKRVRIELALRLPRTRYIGELQCDGSVVITDRIDGGSARFPSMPLAWWQRQVESKTDGLVYYWAKTKTKYDNIRDAVHDVQKMRVVINVINNAREEIAS